MGGSLNRKEGRNYVKNSNIISHKASVTRKLREKHKGHKSIALWFTGFPASGKSTIAHAVEERLFSMGCHTYVFDGDNIRHGLCSDLGFSPEDRSENIRRIGEMVKLFLDAGIIVLAAFVSPYKRDRDWLRELIGESHFIEIYCDCKIEICEQRDIKSHYKKARLGEISDFTGVSAPYEVPENPALHLRTDETSLEECVEKIIQYLFTHGIINTTLKEY